MSYTHREIVWAKPQGYPWWPAIVILFLLRYLSFPKTTKAISKYFLLQKITSIIFLLSSAMLDPKNIRKY